MTFVQLNRLAAARAIGVRGQTCVPVVEYGDGREAVVLIAGVVLMREPGVRVGRVVSEVAVPAKPPDHASVRLAIAEVDLDQPVLMACGVEKGAVGSFLD